MALKNFGSEFEKNEYGSTTLHLLITVLFRFRILFALLVLNSEIRLPVQDSLQLQLRLLWTYNLVQARLVPVS
jgi:hypothetical protein